MVRIVLILLFAIPLIGAIAGMGGGSAQDERAHPERYALSICRDFIKDSLHDPTSAVFDRVYPSPEALADNKYSMTVPLRAKNGFGSMRHFAVDCVVSFNGDSWSLVRLSELN